MEVQAFPMKISGGDFQLPACSVLRFLCLEESALRHSIPQKLKVITDGCSAPGREPPYTGRESQPSRLPESSVTLAIHAPE